MNAHEKTLLLYAAEQIANMAENEQSPIFENDPRREGRREGLICAYQIAAEYLQGLVDRHEEATPPSKATLLAALPEMAKRAKVNL